MARAAAIVESFKRIKISKDQAISRHGQINQLTWTAPPNGCFKVNMDTKVKVLEQKALAVQNVPFRGNVACMEAEAVLFGIKIAQ